MDLKKFLKKLTKDNTYYAEMLDNVAEVYSQYDAGPIALIECVENALYVNFRCDMTSQAVGTVTHDMMKVSSDIIVELDFFTSPDDGILYGEQALASYFSSILYAYEEAQLKKDAELDDSIYTVKDPIYAYGKGKQYKNRVQRLWGDDLE